MASGVTHLPKIYFARKKTALPLFCRLCHLRSTYSALDKTVQVSYMTVLSSYNPAVPGVRSLHFSLEFSFYPKRINNYVLLHNQCYCWPKLNQSKRIAFTMNLIKSALSLTRNLATNFAQSFPAKTNYLTNNPAFSVRNFGTNINQSLSIKTNYFTSNPAPSGKFYFSVLLWTTALSSIWTKIIRLPLTGQSSRVQENNAMWLILIFQHSFGLWKSFIEMFNNSESIHIHHLHLIRLLYFNAFQAFSVKRINLT